MGFTMGRSAALVIRFLQGVVFSLLLAEGAFATDVEGEASGTWTKAGSPYVLTGPLYVRKGNTLRIESGVEVRSPQGYPFSVLYNGSLYASGATFVGPEFVRGTGLYVAGEDTVELSSCRFTSFEYGLKLDDGAHPVIANTTVSGCSYPVWYTGGCAPVYLAGNDFSGNEHDVIVLSGTAHSDADWGAEVLADYVMKGSFTVEHGAVRIRPGARIQCSDYGKTPQRFIRVGSQYSDQKPRLVADGVVFIADSTSRGPMIELFFANGGQSEFGGCEFRGANRNLDAISCHNSDSVFIRHCRFTGLRYGVSMRGKALTVVRDCVFTESVGGVLIGAAQGESSALIEKNCFVRNSDFGVNNMDSLAQVSALNNWWGSSTGPRSAGDSSGVSDRVSSFVAFSPWLTSEPECAR